MSADQPSFRTLASDATKRVTRHTTGLERDEEDGALGVVREMLDRVLARERRHRAGKANVLEAAELEAARDEVTVDVNDE